MRSEGDSYRLFVGDTKVNSFNCLGPEDPHPVHSWKDLHLLETRRREIQKRVELPFWRIVTYWTGTCIRALALDWLIWITVAIFIGIRIQARLGGYDAMPGIAEQLGDTDLDILGGFLSFLLVLFVNQTNTRFFDMYLLAKKCAGQIQDVAGLASTQLPPAAAHRLVRYMNAAQVAGYVGLGGPYSKVHFFDHFNKKHTLLMDQEMNRIAHFDMDSGSATFKELVTWCQKEVSKAHRAGHIDTIEAADLHSHILSLRGSMDGIYDYCDQPTHFFYIHFLCLLSSLYLPLFSIDNAFSAGWGEDADWTVELLNGLIVMLQAIFVVGLRLLGQKMIDPFGDDLEDLSVITYVSTTIENSRIILCSHNNLDVDDTAERKLMQQKMKNQPTLVREGESV